jgi:hypothetical protein
MKPGRFEIVVLALFLVVGIYQLFIPPLIGIADNGDFARLRYPNGLSRIPSEDQDQRFNYFYSKFAIVPEPEVGIYYFHTSSHLFVGAARRLNILLISRDVFDIRVLAALYMICFLLGFYLILIFSRRFAFQWRCLLAAALIGMYTDTAYTAYFNSFYSEPTALAALIIIVGCSLLLMAGRSGIPALAGYFAAAGLLITAKPMYVPFAALFIPFGIYLTRFVSFKYRYAWTGAVSGALLVLAVGYQAITPEWLRMKASYIAIFSVLLPESPRPESDLLALNLKPEWIRYVGTSPYDADGPVETDAAFRAEFTNRVRTLTIPRFLLARPAQLYRVASDIAPQLVTTLPDYAGYYEESSGKPPRTKPLAPWSSVRAGIFPAPLWLLLIYFVSGVAGFGMSLRKQASEFMHGILLLYSLLVAFSAIIFLVPTVTMASIDTRYSITFVSALDLSLIIAAGLLLQLVMPSQQKRN